LRRNLCHLARADDKSNEQFDTAQSLLFQDKKLIK
jgi:hypothetical protein